MFRTLATGQNTPEGLTQSRLSFRVFNKFGDWFERATPWPRHLRTAEYLMLKAQRLTRLTDWGEHDVYTPLDRLLKSIAQDAHFRPTGWRSLNNFLTHTLCVRLQIQDELQRYPEIQKQTIEAPLFIVSLPRTGTTLLQRLLSCDPNTRSPLYWEVLQPTPHPLPQGWSRELRIMRARLCLKYFHWMAPAMQKIHPMEAEAAEECYPLLMRSLLCDWSAFFYGASQYGKWLAQQNRVPSYEIHKAQLQLLQYRFERQRWILKTPFHMLALDALLKVYPDASIIRINRDPSQVIPSLASILTVMRGTLTDRITPQQMGEEALVMCETMARRFTAVRQACQSARFVELDYSDLVNHPLECVKEIYKKCNLQYTDSFETQMRQWLFEHPKTKHGVHRYSLEKFGLDRDGVYKTLDFRHVPHKS